VSVRPAEEATWAANVAAAGQVALDIESHLHDHELATAHQSRPTVAVQNERNGAGTPAVDHGKATGGPPQ
jgi:hypothetical protein